MVAEDFRRAPRRRLCDCFADTGFENSGRSANDRGTISSRYTSRRGIRHQSAAYCQDNESSSARLEEQKFAARSAYECRERHSWFANRGCGEVLVMIGHLSSRRRSPSELRLQRKSAPRRTLALPFSNAFSPVRVKMDQWWFC